MDIVQSCRIYSKHYFILHPNPLFNRKVISYQDGVISKLVYAMAGAEAFFLLFLSVLGFVVLEFSLNPQP